MPVSNQSAPLKKELAQLLGTHSSPHLAQLVFKVSAAHKTLCTLCMELITLHPKCVGLVKAYTTVMLADML